MNEAQSNEQQFQWILYDGRADTLGDTFEASVLESSPRPLTESDASRR
jgi:hypothetical protein